MAVREILRMGDPRLLVRAEPVQVFDTPELHALLADLFDTMAARNGAGLAASQIGVPLRLVVFGIDANPRYPDAEPVPTTTLVNPQIEPLGAELELGWEGCLSVPGLRGEVPRYRRIRYRGFDVSGNALEREAEGFHARVVQHECDHLDGILFPMRMPDMAAFGFEPELEMAGRIPGVT